jgi:hypothetical protein
MPPVLSFASRTCTTCRLQVVHVRQKSLPPKQRRYDSLLCYFLPPKLPFARSLPSFSSTLSCAQHKNKRTLVDNRQVRRRDLPPNATSVPVEAMTQSLPQTCLSRFSSLKTATQ